ncbi:MAG: DUF1552 domain-containing protein [Deltaproteobacteria bacterium]|nr:DUF1552 domain-containing protein [Deltaproteobacteria bacterium]
MAAVTRRGVLTGLGLGLLAAPFVKLLDGRARGAGPTDRPTRLLVFFCPNGTVPHRWRPRAGASAAASGAVTDFDFAPGSILEPLQAVRDRLVVIDGLHFHGADNHEGGMAAMLTNRGGLDSPTGGRSLDQVVAQAIGQGERFPSLELGVQTSAWGGGVQTRMSYAGPGSFVTPDDDPRRVFERLFGTVGGAIGEDPDKLRRRRQSVLDLVRGQTVSLHGRLGRGEQKKLEAHLEALRALEIQLAPPRQASTCEAPAPPEGRAVYDNASFPAVLAAQTELAALALGCGQTRVVSIQCAHTIAPTVMDWVGVADGHHSLSHIDDSNVAGVDQFVATERWYAERFKDVLDALAARPDPDFPESDRTLLDATLVVWAKELGDSRLHVCKDVPFVLAGAGGALPKGRWLRTNGEPHARLLVSVAQLMGLELDTFGDPAAGSGALGGLV